jgi:hypothetical protein
MAKKLQRIEVVPVPAGMWLVYMLHRDILPEAYVWDSKKQAVKHAIMWATYEAGFKRGTSVRIHKRNGRFQEEHTYPHSADPKRSKG